MGEITRSKGYSVGLLEQEPQLDPNKTVKEVVEEGKKELVALLHEYEAVSNSMGDASPDEMEKLIDKQAQLQEKKIEAANGWELESELEIAMDALRVSARRSKSECPLRRRKTPCGALPPHDPGARIFCCSMSRPTISMPNRCNGWSSICNSTKAPSSP